MAGYLQNCWYAFGWAHELENGMLARTALDMRIVAFRTADRTPAAVLDRCPHRFAPLSRGAVRDGVLHCAYHGLGFSGSGECVHNPFGSVPHKAAVRSFPLVERDHILWIWPGESALADPATIPDFSFHHKSNEQDWVVHGYIHMRTGYQIEIDNLMDLSHIETVHRGTFGGRGYINSGQLELREVGEEIHANWWMPSVPLYDLTTGAKLDSRADHFLDTRWSPPSALRLHFSFMPAGTYTGRENSAREDLPGQFQAHLLTPETQRTTHYFWSSKRPTDMNAWMTEEVGRALVLTAFEQEDKPLLEAIEANMPGEFWSSRPIILPNDGGGVRVRRRLARLIRNEQGTPGASAVVEPPEELETQQ
jgi:phenylpropionate dioxygenase-like ring-hydroxylating dioxygenase large terminal subunit